MSTFLITPRVQILARVRDVNTADTIYSESWASLPYPGGNEDVAARLAKEGFWTPEPYRLFYPPQVILSVRVVSNTSVSPP